MEEGRSGTKVEDVVVNTDEEEEGDVEGCIEDCTAALALLQIKPDQGLGASGNSGLNMLASLLPPVGSEKRISWVVKTAVRRGAAYAHSNKIDEAVEDYSLAVSMNPNDEKLQKDLNNIRNYKQGMLEQKKKNTVEQL